MGSPSRPHYDITMSKRTRKPLNLQEEEEEEKLESDRKSLKQLINGDVEGSAKEMSSGKMSSTSLSLGHHFSTEEEKQLQVVKKHDQPDHNGSVKLKGMMSRYAKVLSHLVKVKREAPPCIGRSRNKKHLLRLTM